MNPIKQLHSKRLLQKTLVSLAIFGACSGFVEAGTFPYEAAFNEHGFSTVQTATMVGSDAAVVWFITPGEGRYLIQVSNGSDSWAVQHQVTITDGAGTIVASQQAIAPSFYVTIGRELAPDTGYLMYVNNTKRDGSPSCKNGQTCNVSVLIQPVQ